MSDAASPPAVSDQITFHIRAVGEWTRSLHDKVLEACLKSFLYDQFVLMKATATPHPGPSDLVYARPAPPVPAITAPPPAQRKSGAAAVTPEQLQRLEWLRQAQAESAAHGFVCQRASEESSGGLHNAGFVGDERAQPVRTVSAQVAEPADGGGHCECARCRKIGTVSDRVFDLVGGVLDDLAAGCGRLGEREAAGLGGGHGRTHVDLEEHLLDRDGVGTELGDEVGELCPQLGEAVRQRVGRRRADDAHRHGAGGGAAALDDGIPAAGQPGVDPQHS